MENELITLKQKIKKWEHSFQSREGRPPNKSDIDSSDTDIKEDYVRYNLIKLEINKSKEIDVKINKPKIPEWKKLSTKSFSLERNRKASSQNISIEEVKIDTNSLNSDELRKEKLNQTFEPECKGDRVNIGISSTPKRRVTFQEETVSQRMPQHYNLVQKQQSLRQFRRSISNEWIERHRPDCEISLGNLITSTETPKNSHKSLLSDSIESTLFTKLYEVDTGKQVDVSLMELEMSELIEKCATQQLIDTHTDSKRNSLTVKEKPDFASNTDDGISPSRKDNDRTNDDKVVPIQTPKSASYMEEINELVEESYIEHLDDFSEENVRTLGISPTENKLNRTAPVSSMRTPLHAKDIQEKSDGEKKVQSEVKKRASTSTVSSAKRTKVNNSLSDNFVRLDLRRKHYKAKGRGMTAKAYKRGMFKKKQFDNDRGGTSRGGTGRSTRCFKCGEVGHWARNCSQKIAESDLGKFAGEACSFQETAIEDDQEIFESPLPTLEEAALMAQGKTLSEIRMAEGKDDPSDVPMNSMVIPDKIVVRQEIEPLFSGEMTQSEMDKRLKKALKTLKYSAFKEGQKEAVTRILQGRSTLVLLGTGGGKSLCYQLPAMLYAQRESCTVLVISPLVSLMEDQCLHMPSAISAACLHTNQTSKQRENTLKGMRENKFSVILLSPEMLASQERIVNEVFSQLPPIPFVCIDEVHCLSQWSHNFRPSYLRLCKVIKDRFGVTCVLALTATATRRTVGDLMSRLSVSEEGVIKGAILPDNLKLSVSRSSDRDQALIEMFRTERFSALSSIIVYCTRQKETERIAQLLRTCITDPIDSIGAKSSLSPVAECYHAGMTAGRRNQVQKGFMNGKVKIVVATLAFGMGLNKSDVRAIVHYNMPSSCENYVQEVGRAGRDGVTSYCRVLLDSQDSDLWELRKHVFANGIDSQNLQGFVNAVFPPCRCEKSQACPGHKVGMSVEKSVMEFDIPEGSLGTMLCYCEEKGWLELSQQQYDACKIQCYFGERQLRKLAEKMPVIAAAIALHSSPDSVRKGCLGASISAVSREMGWNYRTLKRELGSLAYNDRGTGGKQNSSIIVEMTDLSYTFKIFHRDDNKTEDVVNFLQAKINEIEMLSLGKLSMFSEMLTNATIDTNETLLREEIQKYFEEDLDYSLPSNPTDSSLIPRLRQEIRSFISTHSDSKLTGRVVARIFHGISSPNYPAHMWGSTMYWRRHLNAGFHMVRKMAEKELESY